MLRLRQAPAVLLMETAVALAPRAVALAQDQGIAAIYSPLEGAFLSSEVPITGTATHDQFVRYELAFAYSPNPTDTWFPIAPSGAGQVINDVLARWDTTQISDG